MKLKKKRVGFTPHITWRYKKNRKNEERHKVRGATCSVWWLCEGYTLIETLIVMAIMAILASMLLAYNNSSTNNVALYADQATLAGVLGRAKSLALEKWTGGGQSACAFGVHFNTNGSYFVYEDVPTGTPPSCNGLHNHAYTSGDTVVQNLALSGSIGFVNPPPDVWFVPPYLTSVDATITIQTKGSAYGVGTTSVQVTSGGAITSL